MRWPWVDALIHADDQVNLFEYALQCVLNRYLDADFNRKRPVVRYKSPAQVAAPEVATVLSALAWTGQSEPIAVQTAFAAGGRLKNPRALSEFA
jgi:hypothetical protein